MSTICQEFVQNAWKKDLCSNCFKARGEHSTICDALSSEINSSTKDMIECSQQQQQQQQQLSPKKSNDYVTFNRQPIGIAEQHSSSSNGVTTVSVSSPAPSSPQRVLSRDGHNLESQNRARDNNRLNEGVGVGSTDAKTIANNFNNNNNVATAGLRSSPRRIGSSGVHLWEIGQPAPKDKRVADDERESKRIDSGSLSDDQAAVDLVHQTNDDDDDWGDDSYDTSVATAVGSANGAIKNDTECKFKLGGSGGGGAFSPTTNGSVTCGKGDGDICSVTSTAEAKSILKENAVVSAPVVDRNKRRRSSVLFVEESQVIGYGGNDYNWEDQESSEEPSDVDSLENYDASEEERALTDLTTVNTQFNSDNTNLLLQRNAAAAAAAAKSAANVHRQKLTASSDSDVAENKSIGVKGAVITTANGGSASNLAASAVSTTMASSVSSIVTKSTPPVNYYSMHATNNKSYLHSSTSSYSQQQQQAAKSETNSWNAAQSFIRSNLFDDKNTNGLHGYLQQQQNGGCDSENEYADSAVSATFSTNGHTAIHSVNGGFHRNGGGGVDNDDNDGDEECSSDNEDGRARAFHEPESNKWQRRQINCQYDRSVAKQAGSSSVPVKRATVSGNTRTSVHQLFNEAPVTAAEIKTVTDRLPTLVFRPMSETSLAPKCGSNGATTSKQINPAVNYNCRGGENSVVTGNDGCSPYGVVNISQLPASGSMSFRNYNNTVPDVPSSPPPASDDESQKTPIHPKHHKASASNLGSPTNGFSSTKPPTTNTNGSSQIHQDQVEENGLQRSPGSRVGSRSAGCTTFQQQQQQQQLPKDEDQQTRSREYAAVNYSCHYASSYVPTGIAARSPTSTSDILSSNRKLQSPVGTRLPPTPLTNPYSSTEILRGISPASPTSPTSPPLSPTGGSPNKPPVTKPKPKLPVKPIVKLKSPEKHDSTNGKRFEIESPDSSAREETTPELEHPRSIVDNSTRVIHRSSAYYQEIDQEFSDNEQLSDNKVRTPNRIYQSRNSGSQSDSAKIKTPKRLAPRPPGSVNGDSATQNNGQFDKSPTETPVKTMAQLSPDAESSSIKSTSTPSHNPSPPSLSKSNSGSTSALSATSSGTMDNHESIGNNNSSGPDSFTSNSPYRAFSSLNTSGSYTLSQNPSLSKSSSSSSSINGSDYYSFKETPTKENKIKKSKFSLKKLLKFARDDHGDGSKSKGKWSLHSGGSGSSSSALGYERKTKLEIIHPFDLIQNAPTDNASLSPSISETSAKCSTFKSTPNDSTSDRQLSKMDIRDSQVTEPPSPEASATVLTEGCSSGDLNFRSRPPPPPRNRGHAEDVAAPKEKFCRPTSTAKQQQHVSSEKPVVSTKRSLVTNGNESEDASSNVVYREHGSRQSSQTIGDNRSSYYSSSMEYANLGDIRNSVAPKKPERCASTSAMDLIAHDANKSSNASNCSDNERNNIVPSERISYNNDVTYYAPPEDQNWRSQPNSDLDEQYTDKGHIVSDQSQPSSFTSDSLSTNSSSSNSRQITATSYQKQNGRYLTRENGMALTTTAKPDSVVASLQTAGDIRSASVAPRINLEAIYAKSTNAHSAQLPPEPASPSIALNDTEESGSDAGAFVWPRKKASRLSLRKTKTVVHKNLEDNYGAVVTANHQTLSQILEQVSVTQQETTSKVGSLKDVPLHWSDFTILEESKVITDGHKAFYSAIWQQNLEVTLLVSQEPLCSTAQTIRNSCVCVPLAEFEDTIPINLFSRTALNTTRGAGGDLCRGTVWVMERMRVETVASIGQSLAQQTENDVEAYEREVCFVLLQIINGLKHLQVLGIEEVDDNMSDFILTMKNNDVNYRLVILPKASSSLADGNRGSTSASAAPEKLSLCQGALLLMLRLLKAETPVESVKAGTVFNGTLPVTPNLQAFKLFAEILLQERATSLSQVKLLLENMLWGPTDLDGSAVATSPSGKFGADQDQVYQRWLDLERSMTLNNLIRTQSLWQIRLTVYEEYMLSFLVRTCAKTLREAANQLQTANNKK